MRRASSLVVAVAGVMVGCATISSAWRSDKDDRFNAGVKALVAGNYGAARTDLSWVAEHFGHQDEGQRALLLIAALEMDPRNPGRRNDVGADLAAGYLKLPDRDLWIDPLAQTLYLLGLELGTEKTDTVEITRTRTLPALPGPTVSARIKAVEQERDRLARRVSSLESQLAEKDKELDRIRKTIKQ